LTRGFSKEAEGEPSLKETGGIGDGRRRKKILGS
jgi:hypothetical protein